MKGKRLSFLRSSNTTAMIPYYTYKKQEKKVFISLKLWPWQPSLRNRQSGVFHSPGQLWTTRCGGPETVTTSYSSSAPSTTNCVSWC